MEATATTRGMHDAATNTWLSPTQLAAWKADGMIVLEDMFSAQEMDEMRAEADNILETQISSSLYHKRRSGRLDWRVREDGKQLNLDKEFFGITLVTDPFKLKATPRPAARLVESTISPGVATH